ncbi:MAG: cysteine--tRNA ligase [Desulfurivibrionaceae bacterium]|nr:cysteine--tRNA ligase [Desulfurivibrionaceae bacterium]
MNTSILDLIGNTPMVPIRRLNKNPKVQIFAKLESMNPGGSVKDRIGKFMIEAAEKSGALTKDKIVLEATSGNTGIALAMVCAVKGYRCMLVMSESASIERRKIMAAYGAEILLTPAKRSTDGAIEQAYAMVREEPDKYFLTDQFNNNANWQTHVESTGPEIWEQTGGQVTDIVATLGTSGTVMGLCQYYSTRHPQVRVTAVEPYLGHKIQGLKNMKESYKPGIFDKNKPYQISNIHDEEAFEMARTLAREEGLFMGMSSGCAMAAALKRAAEMEEGVLVVLFPDSGEKYLSTELFSQKSAEVEETSRLRFYNSLKRKKIPFEPLSSQRVTFYACGPTTHEATNLSHCRRFIVADLIHRTLAARGYHVDFLMNFTDLDDNTIAGAENSNQSVAQFTAPYMEAFRSDMAALGMKEPVTMPKASDYVERMIEIAHDLIHKGYAYELHGSIYFDISKFGEYGRLSRVDLDKIRSGQSVDLDEYEKHSPLDFTLMKRSTLSELKQGIFFQTDFGNMRPGWHIECAAMTLSHLGDTMDIHTASRNLIFPHHENENAIAKALTGKPLANYWLHSELLLKDGKMMSAENSNIITLAEVRAEGFSNREVRFFLLRHHYRKPIEFSFAKLTAARVSLRRLDEFCKKLLCLAPGNPHPEVATFLTRLENTFFAAMDDDMNISKALGGLFDFIKKVNGILANGQLGADQKKYILETLEKINSLVNIMVLEECPLNPEINELIKKREEARKSKDWQSADAARRRLEEKGIIITDTATGPVWCLSAGSCQACGAGKCAQK